MNIGQAIRQLRENAGIKQKELAKEIGISPQSLWAIESGRCAPKQSTIEKFCEYMEIPIGKLFLEAMTVNDFAGLNGSDAVDVMDIISLATLRINRSLSRYNGEVEE